MFTENIQTLKIHKLTQEQYNRELKNGTLDEYALYLTPDETINLSGYATVEQLNEKADASHTHDDIYYTETEIDELVSDINDSISGKADTTHTHTISDVTNLKSSLDGKVAINRTINGKQLNEDITLSASDVGADSAGSANAALDSAKEYADSLASSKADLVHSHNDIYYTEAEIDEKVTATNTSISNIVDGTTVVAKANYASTADNATSATSAEKAVQDASGNIIASTYETKTDAAAKLTEAKSYADSVKDDLLNGAGDAYDTLKELGDLIDSNTDAIDALREVAANKQAAITGAATTITSSDLTTSRTLVSDASGKVAVSDITSAELNYLDGVTSNVQTQLNNINQVPACTTADNGKLLCVVNGVATWTAMSNGDEVDY